MSVKMKLAHQSYTKSPKLQKGGHTQHIIIIKRRESRRSGIKRKRKRMHKSRVCSLSLTISTQGTYFLCYEAIICIWFGQTPNTSERFSGSLKSKQTKLNFNLPGASGEAWCFGSPHKSRFCLSLSWEKIIIPCFTTEQFTGGDGILMPMLWPNSLNHLIFLEIVCLLVTGIGEGERTKDFTVKGPGLLASQSHPYVFLEILWLLLPASENPHYK